MPEGQNRGRGRPTKLDPAVATDICAKIELGVPFKYACESNGISEDAGHLWMRRGEGAAKGDEKYSQFYQAVTRARAKCVADLVVTAKVGENGARWLLERRFSKDFGSKQTLEHSGPDGAPIQVQTLRDLSDAELERLANARHG